MNLHVDKLEHLCHTSGFSWRVYESVGKFIHYYAKNRDNLVLM